MSPHPLPRLNRAALECGEEKLDSLIDEHPARVLDICNIDQDAAAELLKRGAVDMRPDLARRHPNVDPDEAVSIAASALLIGICVAVFATNHANGHGRSTAGPTMSDAEVDVALGQITDAVARHQGAGADTPDGLAESLEALADVRAVFREATGIGAPR